MDCPCNMKNIEKRFLQSKVYGQKNNPQKCFGFYFTCSFSFNNDLSSTCSGFLCFKNKTKNRTNIFFSVSSTVSQSYSLASTSVLCRLFQVSLSYLIPNSKPDFKPHPPLEMAYQLH